MAACVLYLFLAVLCIGLRSVVVALVVILTSEHLVCSSSDCSDETVPFVLMCFQSLSDPRFSFFKQL